MKNSQLYQIVTLLVCAALLAGCSALSAPEPTATAVPSPTTAPTATQPPTPTTAPTATTAPTLPPTQPAATQPPAATAAPTQGPIPTLPTSFINDQFVRSGSGAATVALSGSVNAGTYDRYRMTAATGEGLDIRLNSPQGTAGFVLLGPNGQPLSGTENQRAQWYSANAQSTGEYSIIVGSLLGRSDYNLEIKVMAGPGTPAGAYSALPDAECRELRGAVRATLGVPVEVSAGGFSLNNGQGGACVLTASGTGVDFPSMEAIVTGLTGALSDWSSAAGYSSDGLNSVVRGFTRGNDLLVFAVQVQPGPAASCPANTAVEKCGLPPDQVIYNVLIQAGRK